jgi:ribonuclease R
MDPRDDAPCLLSLYKAYTDPSPSSPSSASSASAPLYTRPDVVCHDDLDTFTIDPTDSKDFDDAISVDVVASTIYVHIVDIASVPLTKVEEERLKRRCLTLYLANEHVEHLLDEETASHRLSLVVGHQRPTVTVKLVMRDGLVQSYEVYRSTIVVKRRYTYEEALAELASTSALQYLDALTRQRSSAVDYTIRLPSLRLTVDRGTGLLTEARLEETNDPAHSLVATAMILANLTVSKHLAEKGVLLPNRFHAPLRGFVRPEEMPITHNEVVDSFILVKRYSRACYSIDEKGHFGLGLTDYVHFTSPMRRYADVLVHRLLAGMTVPDLAEQVEHLNHRARVVRSLQDLYERWKVTRYLRTLGGPHIVYITDVKAAGILWFMPSLMLNGFCHISMVRPRQYWSLSDDCLVGAVDTIRTGGAYRADVHAIDPGSCEVKIVIHADLPV